MLEKLRALILRDRAKEEALRIAREQYEAAKREIDEEFGDTKAPVIEERERVKAWMLENYEGNGRKTHFEPNASVELRKSTPKYVVKDDKNLLRFLMAEGLVGALEYKKSQVNTLAKEKSIPDDLIEVVQEDEIAVTIT